MADVMTTEARRIATETGDRVAGAMLDHLANEIDRLNAQLAKFKPGPYQPGSVGTTDEDGRMVWTWSEGGDCE